MGVYLALIALIIIGYMILYSQERAYKNIYFVVIALSLILIVGLRHVSLGIFDTERLYVPRFERFFNQDYMYIIRNRRKDTTFYIFARLLSEIYANVHFVLFVIGIPYMLSVTRLIKKYSKIPWLSFLLFLGLQYFMLSFFLLRHVVGLAIVIIAFDYIVQRKPVKFVICVLVATAFHLMSFVFIVAYPLTKIKSMKVRVSMIGICLLFALWLGDGILLVVHVVLSIFLDNTERFAIFQIHGIGLSYVGYLIQLVVFITVTFMYQRKVSTEGSSVITFSRLKIRIKSLKKSKKKGFIDESQKEEVMNIMYNLSAISLSIMSFTAILGEFFRVSSFFGIFNIILLPNAITYIKSSSLRMAAKVGIGIVFVLYFLFFNLSNTNGIPYRMFWQS